MEPTVETNKRQRLPFFWAFMIIYVLYVAVGYLLSYICDNDMFRNDEFPAITMAVFSVVDTILVMVVPGIVAHYVYKKCRRRWYVWLCPVGLMLFNIGIFMLWLQGYRGALNFLPLLCEMPLCALLPPESWFPSLTPMMLVDMVVLPSIVYAACIWLAMLLVRGLEKQHDIKG